MNEPDWLTDQFELHRPRLRAVAYRMLGSMSDADDAVQEAWQRIRDQDPGTVENMWAWLATVVGRVCLNMLRARRARPDSVPTNRLPDPVVSLSATVDPEQEAVLTDSVGLALLVVLDALTPAERVAFVLHDVFGVPFADIATALDRSVAAVQQLASRARRHVRDLPEPDSDPTRQRSIVTAFFAAARDGNFGALLEVLHPDVTLRIDGGVLRAQASIVLRGADEVARHTSTYGGLHPFVRPAVVNGSAGAIVAPYGRLFSVMAFAFAGGKITAIDAVADPERLAGLDLDLDLDTA